MTGPGSPAAIDADQAGAIFAEFASVSDPALRFPADGCYARTHVMVQQLLDKGLAPTKVWAFAASNADLLWIENADQADGRVHWACHVAPVLLVRVPDGGAREMVFDPILFSGPVTLQEWRNALRDTPTVVQTAL
jgi:hypothetical protein